MKLSKTDRLLVCWRTKTENKNNGKFCNDRGLLKSYNSICHDFFEIASTNF
jgi:hypothetical protein